MKLPRTSPWHRGLAAATGGLVLLTPWLDAAPFLYTSGDLVLVLRQTGNANDLIVHVGRASTFSTLDPGTRVVVSNLTASQLAAAFPSLNGLKWTVAGANRPPVDPAYPLQTFWVTAPRENPGTPATPWLRKGQFVQGNAASQIDALGVNAALGSSLQPAGPNNTATGVVLSVSSPFTIGPALGEAGDLANNFQGRVENVTPDDFDADPGNVSRADLIELLPGTTAAGTINQPGRVLGSFELKPDGSLEFVAASTAAPAPVITGIQRTGDVTSVSFPTVSGVTYLLRSTDGPGLASPPATWTAGATVVGTGSSATLQDTATGDLRFYVVEALP